MTALEKSSRSSHTTICFPITSDKMASHLLAQFFPVTLRPLESLHNAHFVTSFSFTITVLNSGAVGQVIGGRLIRNKPISVARLSSVVQRALGKLY